MTRTNRNSAFIRGEMHIAWSHFADGFSGCTGDVGWNVIGTICGYVPGLCHAIYVVKQGKGWEEKYEMSYDENYRAPRPRRNVDV